MNERYNLVADYMAKVGYETMFEDKWDALPKHSVERKMWRNIALKMLSELWRVYKPSSGASKEE